MIYLLRRNKEADSKTFFGQKKGGITCSKTEK